MLYADYLDYLMNTNGADQNNDLRLRFDLLVFYDKTICLSVPACIKTKATTELIVLLSDFWKAGRIRIILDKKHDQDPFKYINNRIAKLERSITTDALRDHFEYAAYTSDRPNFFFNGYLANLLTNIPLSVKVNCTP